MTGAAVPGVVASSRRRGGGAPVILGYNTKDTSSQSGFAVGRMYVSKFTLAAAATLNELHGWMGSSSASGGQVRLVIYAADGTSGNPGTRLAYTNIVTYSGDTEVQQAGFAVALAAGDYWIGFSCLSTGGGGSTQCYCAATGGTHIGKTGGASDPPNNPFGSTDTSGTRKHCVWAVLT